MIRTFLDAGVLIAAIRGTPVPLARALMVMNDPNRVFLTSDFVCLEVLPKPLHFRLQAEVDFYEAYFALATEMVETSPALVRQAYMDMPPHALPMAEIVRRYPDQWVLVEETSWDAHGHPVAGRVRAARTSRRDVREPVRHCHQDAAVTTFLLYTGDPLPAHRTVVR